MGGGVFIGRVVSNRMQKTVVVAVHYAIWVPKYKAYQRRASRHKAHDEDQACAVGDIVRIRATRRMSKHKSYMVTDILRQAKVYREENAARIVQEREARPVLSALEAAERRLDETSARLSALRKMYAKEVGQDVSMSSVPKP